MRLFILTAGLLAAAAATPAFAQQGPKLDDPGYSVKGPRSLTQDSRDLTKMPPGQDEAPPDDGSDEGNGPGGPSAKDRLLPPSSDKYMPPPPPTCLSVDQAISRLSSQGWQDLHCEVVLDETTSKVRARYSDGRLFELTVNRCSALVLDARLNRTYTCNAPNGYVADRGYGADRYYYSHGHGHWHGHWHRHRHCVRHGNHRHCHWHWHRNRHVHHHHGHRHHWHRHHHHHGHRHHHHHRWAHHHRHHGGHHHHHHHRRR
jgi:hypothetical protein